jgi:inward rectifier potassium channel
MTTLGDLYHRLVSSSWPRLLALVVVAFVAVNTFFALGYLLGGDAIENARPGSFADAFFFSVQTMATIGYGKLAPRTLYANVLVTVEVLMGLMGLAMVTGLTFAKFSRPTARVRFTQHAVIVTHDGVPSLMFRMANARGNNIVEAQVHVVLARNETTIEGEQMRRFHDLDLSRRQSALFTLSWTAIHPITGASPLHGITPAALEAADAEIVVSLLGFDETFSQTVHARHRYVPGDLVWEARFADILFRPADGRRRIDYSRFDEVVPITSPSGRGKGE